MLAPVLVCEQFCHTCTTQAAWMDMQAPDLFASAPNLQLRRTVAIGSEALEEGGVRRSNDTIVCRGRHKGRILAARSWRRERHGGGDGRPLGAGSTRETPHPKSVQTAVSPFCNLCVGYVPTFVFSFLVKSLACGAPP